MYNAYGAPLDQVVPVKEAAKVMAGSFMRLFPPFPTHTHGMSDQEENALMETEQTEPTTCPVHADDLKRFYGACPRDARIVSSPLTLHFQHTSFPSNKCTGGYHIPLRLKRMQESFLLASSVSSWWPHLEKKFMFETNPTPPANNFRLNWRRPHHTKLILVVFTHSL